MSNRLARFHVEMEAYQRLAKILTDALALYEFCVANGLKLPPMLVKLMDINDSDPAPPGTKVLPEEHRQESNDG